MLDEKKCKSVYYRLIVDAIIDGEMEDLKKATIAFWELRDILKCESSRFTLLFDLYHHVTEEERMVRLNIHRLDWDTRKKIVTFTNHKKCREVSFDLTKLNEDEKDYLYDDLLDNIKAEKEIDLDNYRKEVYTMNSFDYEDMT